MRSGVRALGRVELWTVSIGILFACLVAGQSWAQTNSNERAFPQSKAAVEKALAAMQASLAGRLPVLDGFAKPGEHPLDRYQRGYYQAEVQVRVSASGGSVVQISTKVTAWYADPAASHSGYELLISNGRIEADILDQLAEQLAKATTESASKAASVVTPKPSAEPSPAERPTAARSPAAEPTISAPSPKFPETDRTFSSSLSQGLAAEVKAKNGPGPEATSEKSKSALQLEADSLEEVLKNQGHPKNLVAVKKSGTPVVATPSLTAKPEFLASMHDEFEMLDFNADWVHVRVSGLSRGWIWRNSVEMPGGIPDSAAASPAQAPAGDLFHVVREETSTFPGDWEPLKNKSVKIISVQKVEGDTKDAGPKDRLEYAKYLLGKSFETTGQKPPEVAGVVVIFDAADGGMIAATMAALQQWKAGTLSDAALWHRCFLDPPETFDASGSSASQ
jgi:hypothetical protein